MNQKTDMKASQKDKVMENIGELKRQDRMGRYNILKKKTVTMLYI